MAKNYVNSGSNIAYPLTEDVESGGIVAMGNLIGVATTSGKAGETVDVQITGVWELPRVGTEELSVGTPMFFDASAGALTTDDGGGANKKAGYVALPEAEDTGVCSILLDVSSGSASAVVEDGSITEAKLATALANKINGKADQSELDDKADVSDLTAHTEAMDNPHGVTAEQVGLGNVDNTADADKPISTAMQSALDEKLSATQGAAVADSTATDVETLVTDFNNLLASLRSAGIIST